MTRAAVLHRLRDARPIETLLKRPEIASLDYGFDARGWISNQSNIALTDGSSVGLFGATGGQVFDTHWLFVARGREALDLGADMIAAMFDLYGAVALKGMIPTERRASRWFTRKLGCRSLGMVDTVRGPHELFTLARTDFER